nr:amino acid ABC transporter ATP-binding protein [Clostridium sp. Marseille-P3244]
MSVIHIEGLAKSFGSNLVFQDINVDIEKGDCISVIGPSGCGKSTFLRCINLLERPSAGRVYIDGQEITARGAPLDQIRRKMGMVYQTFNLFSHKTVLENVMMAPMHLRGLSRQEAMELAMDCLGQVGMVERADYMPSQLSGGQKQRAAIARCIAMKPEIILFDEPTSALDPTMVDEVLAVIRRLVNRGMTCIIVTHEMNFARAISSGVIYMDEKGIYEMGPPSQVFDAPKRERTKAFINRLKTYRQTVTERDFDIYGLNGAVVEFCRRQFASEKQIYRVQLVLEELLINIMLPQMKGERIAIDVTVEYSMKDSTLSVTAFADQDFSMELQGEDSLSLDMLKAVCTNIVREGNSVRLCL